MDQEQARKQAEREHGSNQGPASTNGWDADSRNAYEAEHQRLKEEAQKKSS